MGSIQIAKIRDDVIGIKPLYTETGNSTLLYLTRGEVLVKRTIYAVLNALCRSYAIDLKAQRKNIADMLERRGVLPFYIGRRVFVPLKMRKKVSENDMAYGYIDLDFAGDVKSAGTCECMLYLKDGRSIEVLNTRITVVNTLEMGQRLLALLPGYQMKPSDDDDVTLAVLGFTNILRSIRDSLARIEEQMK